MAATNHVIQMPAIPAEVRDRIVQAANALYEQAEYQAFPTVDQVRRLAKTDMNATSAVMRDWRREQTARAAPVAVQVPEPVATANTQALAALWTEAQKLANQSLQDAQTAWEGERAQLDTLRQELASAYESVAAELDDEKTRAAAAEHDRQRALEQAAAELIGMRAQLANATGRADRAEASLAEHERREADLRADLDRERTAAAAERERSAATELNLHADLDVARAQWVESKAKAVADEQRYSEQRSQAAKAAHDLAERMTKVQAERDHDRKAVLQAREQAARLQGQLDAVQQHNADLLRALGGGGKP